MLTPATVINKMIELLSDPHKWTKGASARNLVEKQVDVFADDACKWAIDGAKHYFIPRIKCNLDLEVSSYLIKATEICYPSAPGYVYLNDHYGYNATMIMLYRAHVLALKG